MSLPKVDTPSGRPERNRRRGPRGALGLTSAVIAIALSVSACGSSSSSTSSSSMSSSSSSAGGSASGPAGMSAAKATIAPYTGQTSAFPVDKPLSKPIPAGTKFVYLQCGAQACAVAGKQIAAAVKVLGGELTTINAGTTSTTAQAAASSVLALKPAAVLATGIDPQLYGDNLKKISEAGIKIVTITVAVPTEPFGITANYLGAPTFQLAGRLLADWVVVNTGATAKVAFYGVPEITFSPIMMKAFQDELSKNCPSCGVRTSEVAIATLGTTAPRTIVTDLQAHPDTDVVVLSTGNLANGLPAALSAAGLKTSIVTYSPQAINLQDIKDGKISAGLAADYAVSVWTGVDVAARLIEGDQPTAPEQAGEVPFQLLEPKDITFDPANGWTGYPDYQQRFTTLWHPAG